MRLNVAVNGTNYTGSALAEGIGINKSITDRASTAEVTFQLHGTQAAARYDSAHYDADRYGVSVRELDEIVITNEADGSRQFGGIITRLEYDLKKYDPAAGSGSIVEVKAICNDWTWLLDSTVIASETFDGKNEREILQTLFGRYLPQISTLTANITPYLTLDYFEVKDKSLRDVCDELTELSGVEWRVDYDKALHYFAPTANPAAFGLSNNPNHSTTFPIDAFTSYSRDFIRVVNRCTVLGAILSGGTEIRVVYEDPLSVAQYGVRAHTIIDRNIQTASDALARAAAQVAENAFPKESLKIETLSDGLDIGQALPVYHRDFRISGTYVIYGIRMSQKTGSITRYEMEVGAREPSEIRLMRRLDALSRRSTRQPEAVPVDGTVTDDKITGSGLTSGSITSVNSSALLGPITAGQIGSVSATSIIGTITAGQIGTITAGQITGTISAGQIGSVSATSITGLIAASQIGSVAAATITGSITAGQIGSVTAASITGTITASQISTVAATSITGSITSAQIGSVAATAITGSITSTQIGSVDATSIVGSITSSQISSVAASTITGSITAGQIATITAGQITGSITSGQISSVAASTITGSITSGQIASVAAASITGSITSSQISSVAATSITGSITAGQISSVAASSITGTLSSGQIGSVAATSITGSITAGQIGSVAATTITGVIVSSQVADDLINSLGKLANALRPIPNLASSPTLPDANYPAGSFYRNTGSGTFYENVAGTWTATTQGAAVTGKFEYFNLGTIEASSIIGLIAAAQIGSIAAGQITGTITSGQISSVAASTITGTITASQIASVAATSITGSITSGQIATITAGQITGSITSSQIGSVAATSITGSITSGQISSVAATSITGTLNSSQIASVTAASITGTITSSQIGSVAATTVTGTLTASQIASVNASSVTGTLSASQINTVTAGQITGTLTASQIASVAASSITGSITSSQILSVSASAIVGSLTAGQIGAVNASVIQGTITVSQLAGGITADKITTVYVGNIAAGGTGNNGYLNTDLLPFGNSDNLLVNPSFEAGSANWPDNSKGDRQPNLWQFFNTTTSSRSGAYCIAHYSGGTPDGSPAGPNDYNFAFLGSSPWVKLTAGDQYTLEGYIWNSSTPYPNGTLEIYLDTFQPDATYIGAICYTALTTEGRGSGWYKFTASGTSAANASYGRVSVVIRNHTSGQAWLVDDLMLVRRIAGNQIQPLTITAGNIAALTITAGQMANATITATQVANATLTGTNIASQTLTATNIANLTITNAQIANQTITATQIANATITGTQIANATITAAKIAAATITATEIAALTITAGNIANLTITGGKIANATIDDAKITTLSASKITAGTISASISLTSPTLVITSGTTTINIDGTNKILVTDTTQTSFAQVLGSQVRVEATNNNLVYAQIVKSGFQSQNASGNSCELRGDGLRFNTTKVVGPQYSPRPVTLADVITLLVTHGLSV